MGLSLVLKLAEAGYFQGLLRPLIELRGLAIIVKVSRIGDPPEPPQLSCGRHQTLVGNRHPLHPPTGPSGSPATPCVPRGQREFDRDT
jgi:hypothetical protein